MHDLSMRVVCSCSTWYASLSFFTRHYFANVTFFSGSSYSLSETEVLSGWFEGDNEYQVQCAVCGKLTPVYLCFERLRKTPSWHSTLVLPSLKYGEQIYLLKPSHFREELEVISMASTFSPSEIYCYC
jgi:hypothetical protein